MLFIFIGSSGIAQDQLLFTGNLQLNANVFLKDEAIGASNTPQYEDEIFGGESWLEVKLGYKGFEAGIRGDFFVNSNLLNPNDSYTDQGIGRFYLKKNWKNLQLEAGHLYGQIGSGIIFRAYEERPLLIDNALFGFLANYTFLENWNIKIFAGKQKNLFDLNESKVKGVNLEGFTFLGKSNKISIAPGMGLVNKTWSESQIENLIGTVQTYTPDDSIGLYYNTYAFSFYNTFSAGPFVWYAEAAIKKSRHLF